MELVVVDLIAEEEDRGEALCRELNGASSGWAEDAERLWDWSPGASGRSLICTARLPGFSLSEHGGLVYAQAAARLSGYIIERYEPVLIRTIIRKQFHYTGDEEIATIEQCCRLVLSGEQWQIEEPHPLAGGEASSRGQREARVAAELESFLAENTRLNLQGFVTFRLQGYWQELREAAEYAVEEYVMDKQYQEFISLLKYFVSVQPSRRKLVHVVQDDGQEIQLLDADFLPLDTRSEDRAIAELVDAELNVEDMVLSSLISAAPASIRIHTPTPDHQVIRTIQAIFEQRAEVCPGCRDCGVGGTSQALGAGEP